MEYKNIDLNAGRDKQHEAVREGSHGSPVITPMPAPEDHLQRLKIEHQEKAKLREKQCAYFHDSCSRRAYFKRNEIN